VLENPRISSDVPQITALPRRDCARSLHFDKTEMSSDPATTPTTDHKFVNLTIVKEPNGFRGVPRAWLSRAARICHPTCLVVALSCVDEPV
jgi:hypothetical protein